MVLAGLRGKNSAWKAALKDAQSMKLFTPPGCQNPDDLKSVGGKGVASELDIGDTGLKKTFISGMTPVISIWERRARDFCECGDRNIATGH